MSFGSCDTEDWTNDAENSILFYFTIYSHGEGFITFYSYIRIINNNLIVYQNVY